MLLAVLIGWWIFCLPDQLFSDPTCTVLNDRQGQLLNARIASDGQWRFPETDSVPKRFEHCLLEYEDRRFFSHFGIDLRAVARAAQQNWNQGEIVSGASTLTMQLMRMSRRAESRSVLQKLIETVWATRAEMRYSKNELLRLYASHAPFGGNVVGLDAAAWRYFHKPAHSLTWAESAVLAVLPNAPGLIYPGRNTEALRQKRDQLLQRLKNAGFIDEETYALSLLETLPGMPLALPNRAPHLLQFAAKSTTGGANITSTLNVTFQEGMTRLLERHIEVLSRNHIQNGAVLVADVETGAVLAYTGNVSRSSGNHGESNDMIQTPRSSGSILKPFLYGQMLQRGVLTPQQIVADIPTQYAGFSPKNFDEAYSGAAPADEALARSLNIPAVRMLKEYGVPIFHNDLQKMGFSTIDRHAGHYGLSLILGGAETTLWELVSAYRILANQLNRGSENQMDAGLHYRADQKTDSIDWPMGLGAAWATAEAMSLLNRPEGEDQWKAFAGSQKIAWKTGTSYGFRDAWAVGFNRKHVVGIWVGNASGEGRPGITGLNAAAPLMFEAFNRLPATTWFEEPVWALQTVPICDHSGMRASERCGSVRQKAIPQTALNTTACNYCQFLHLDQSGNYQVNSNCYPAEQIHRVSRFVLPPLQEWYYRRNHANYRPAPPWLADCGQNWSDATMRLIYPRETSQILIPRELDGRKENVVLKAAHRNAGTTIYWHLDNEFLGETSDLHHIEIQVNAGEHQLTLVDKEGYEVKTVLKVIEREN